MLVKDETVGCLSKTLPKVKLSQPHSSSLIDFDGDCLSDLFLTVTDISSGINYYEIYLRREKISVSEDSETGDDKTSGLNSYCLVAREEIPENALFQFKDVDRDGMIDMVYTNPKDLSLNIHFNHLQNELRAQESTSQGIHLFKPKNVCASTQRAITLIKFIFTPPDKVTKDSPNVIRINFGSVTNVKSFMQVSNEMPGMFYLADIGSDGYPDLLITLALKSGKS